MSKDKKPKATLRLYFKYGLSFSAFANEALRTVYVKLNNTSGAFVESPSGEFRIPHAAHVTLSEEKGELVKCHPDDTFNETLGATIGVHRLLKRLAALSRVHYLDQALKATNFKDLVNIKLQNTLDANKKKTDQAD